MRLNRKTLIFALVLIIIIVATALLLNTPEPDSDADSSTTAEGISLFPEIAGSDVTLLTVTRLTLVEENLAQERFSLERDTADSLWEIADDSDVTSERPLVQESIADAVDTLTSFQSAQQFASDDLAAFGLDSVAKTIEFVAGDETYSVQVGNLNPQGMNYYALVGDDTETIYLLSGANNVGFLLSLVDDPPFEPEPTPTPVPVLNLPGPLFDTFAQEAVTRLHLVDNSNDDTLTLVKDSELGLWDVTESSRAAENQEVDQPVVDIMLSLLGSLRAVDALTGANLDNLGLVEAHYTLQFEQGASSHQLRIGGLDPSDSRYYLLVDDFEQVAVVPAADVDILLQFISQPPLVTVETTPEATESSN